MVRRKAPVPLVAVAILLAYWVATAPAGSINAVRCEADHQEYLAAIAGNRNATIKEINDQISDTTHPQTKAGLIAMRESLWDEEEQQRSRAQQVLNDCLNAVNRIKHPN